MDDRAINIRFVDKSKSQNSGAKACETCRCLTCEKGMLFSGACVRFGVNCKICNGSNPHAECPDFKSGY